MTEESVLCAELNRVIVCREIQGSFEQCVLPHLIKMCDKRAKQVRSNVEDFACIVQGLLQNKRDATNSSCSSLLLSSCAKFSAFLCIFKTPNKIHSSLH